MANEKKPVAVKKVVEKKTMTPEDRSKAVANLLKQLSVATDRHEKSQIRGKLRRLNYFGGARKRSYLDKTTGKVVEIAHEKKTSVKKVDKSLVKA
jgi:hypothetical protein